MVPDAGESAAFRGLKLTAQAVDERRVRELLVATAEIKWTRTSSTGSCWSLCLLLSFLLSGMEAGVFALSRLRVRRLARAGKPSAKLLQGFLERPEKFLWTILVGNTLANFLILGWMLVENA